MMHHTPEKSQIAILESLGYTMTQDEDQHDREWTHPTLKTTFSDVSGTDWNWHSIESLLAHVERVQHSQGAWAMKYAVLRRIEQGNPAEMLQAGSPT